MNLLSSKGTIWSLLGGLCGAALWQPFRLLLIGDWHRMSIGPTMGKTVLLQHSESNDYFSP